MPRGSWAQSCVYKRHRLRVRFSLEEMKYLLFSFPRSGNQAKRGVELQKRGTVVTLIKLGLKKVTTRFEYDCKCDVRRFGSDSI